MSRGTREEKQMDIKYRDWGTGIPEYTPEDVLSIDEIQKLCVTYAGSMYAEGGYDVDGAIYDRGRYPNVVAKKDGKTYRIAVMGEQWPLNGHMSVLHMRDYYESCAEHGGIACIAAVSLKSNDGERAKAALTLRGDKLQAVTCNVHQISEDDFTAPRIGTDAYEVYCLECVAYGYETGKFARMLELMTDDCQWNSQWVPEPRVGKAVLTDYYAEKAAAMAEGPCYPQLTLMETDGKTEIVHPDKLYINGMECSQPTGLGMYIPKGTKCMLCTQKLPGKTIVTMFTINLDDKGKISGININDPCFFGSFREYYRIRR
jgi:hypothetical protein